MPQTILALLAMMIATLFAMQQQRQALHAQRNMIRNELAMQGTGVAEDILGVIGSMAFDERTSELEEGEELSSTSMLTPETAAAPPYFGPNHDGTQNNDIDDFHHSSIDSALLVRTVQRVDEATGTLETHTLEFEAEVEISYANPNDPETEAAARTKTKAKKATVRVWSTIVPHPDTIEVSRTYLCGSKCGD